MMTNGKKITISTAIKDAVDILSLNKSIETPRLDTEVLLSYVLKCDRIYLAINSAKNMSEYDYEQFLTLINRRAENEPVSYITGTKEFMSLNFKVKPGVLIPRPDTEILVEEIINKYKNRTVSILDLCTGSGAIAVSLAYYIKNSTIFAVDKYDVCIETAKYNAEINSVSNQVNFVKADILDNFNIDKTFDCIVSNPPYIEKDTLPSLPLDVKNYEPMYALDGGDDGLVFYKKIIEFSVNKLSKGGVLAFEIGYNQAESVKELIKETQSFDSVQALKDLAGLDRVIICEKR